MDYANMELALPDHPTKSDSEHRSQDNFYTPANHEFYRRKPYSDLDRTAQEIRLLQIILVEEDTPLQMKVTSHCLRSSQPPSYGAISYFAGNHKETEEVFVNGIRFNAFANLARALRQVIQVSKRRNIPQLIWVDQICINQSDLAERSHQVGFMRSIYNSADIVLACLGGDQDLGSEQAAATAGRSEECEDIVVVDGVFTELDEVMFSTGCELFTPIFDNPWWQRGWICQEVIVAKEVLVLYCGLAIYWQTLSFLRDELHYNSQARIKWIAQNDWSEHIAIIADGRFCLPMMTCSGANFMMGGRKMSIKGKKENIIRVFSHAQTCRVTDPRDKIFAFLGLVDPGYSIIPDYGLDESAVLRYTCQRIILYENSLNILTCCDYGRNRPQGIPSWTPTWSDPGNGPPLPVSFIYDAENDHPPFRASAGLRADAVFGSHNSVADIVLTVQCLFIDSLAMQDSIGPMPSPEFHENDILDWRRTVGLKYKPEDIHYSGCVAWRGRDTDEIYGSEAMFVHALENARFDTEGYGRFFRSPKGYVGVARGIADLRATDLICVLYGANMPLILRKVEDFYVLVSDAYVEGLMYGEAIDMMTVKGNTEQDQLRQTVKSLLCGTQGTTAPPATIGLYAQGFINEITA